MVQDVSQAAANGAGSEEVQSETDVDEDLHDYRNDGSLRLLPDTMTTIHTVKSNGERTAQLAADQADILFELGLADLEARYPRHITFVHTRDSDSEKDVARALICGGVELFLTATSAGPKLNCSPPLAFPSPV